MGEQNYKCLSLGSQGGMREEAVGAGASGHEQACRDTEMKCGEMPEPSPWLPVLSHMILAMHMHVPVG